MSGSEFQGELTDTHGQGSLPYPGINVLDAIAGSAGMYVVSLRTIVQGATLSGQVDDQGLHLTVQGDLLVKSLDDLRPHLSIHVDGQPVR